MNGDEGTISVTYNKVFQLIADKINQVNGSKKPKTAESTEIIFEPAILDDKMVKILLLVRQNCPRPIGIRTFLPFKLSLG